MSKQNNYYKTIENIRKIHTLELLLAAGSRNTLNLFK